jgi:hypothetical protein
VIESNILATSNPKTTDIVTAKLVINDILSTPNGNFMVGDLDDFYLGKTMTR